MIVTVDHMGAGRMWNDVQLDKWNFYSVQLDTYLSYEKEFMYQPPLFSAKNDNQELGLAFIFKSMTKQQQNIIKFIATFHLENPEEKKGITFNQLKEICIENLICNNNKAIKEYLAEARDHKVVHEKVD